MNPARTFSISSVIFALVGIIMIGVGGFFAYKQLQFSQTAVSITGKVMQSVRHVSRKGNVSYYPIVSFQDSKGTTIEFRSSVSSSSYNSGDSLPVVYDPLNPHTAYIDTFMGRFFIAVLVGGMGIVFFATGAGILTARRRRNKVIDELKMNGRKIQATLTSVGLDTRYRVNGRSPFAIFAQWQDPVTQKLVAFKSESIWYDPTQFVKPGMTIDVLIDSNDSSKYWMNTDFLPPM